VILLDNLVKYSPALTVVGIQCIPRKDKKVVLGVSDRGPGIKTEDFSAYFRRFYRADDSHSKKTDRWLWPLGLAITKKIADLHQKVPIDVKATPGEGSVSQFTLPAHN